MLFQHLPGLRLQRLLQRFESRSMRGNELPVYASARDQLLHHSIEKSNIAANHDREEVIHEFCAKQCAASDRRYPVILQAGLTIRIDDNDPGSFLLCVV